jgi:hypothetical protein
MAGGYECLKPPDPPIAKLNMLSSEIFSCVTKANAASHLDLAAEANPIRELVV